MADFIDLLSPSAIADLDKANRKILEIVANINRANQSFNQLTVPSASSDEVQRLNDQLRTQERLIGDLQQRIERLSRTRQNNNNRTAQEIVNQQILNRNALEYARINSRLVGAYQRLSTEHARASRALQDLIARGRLATQTQREYNEELREAQALFNGLNNRVLSADRAVGRFNRNVGNYPRQAILGVQNLMGAFGIAGGLSLAAGIAKDIYNTTKEIQSLDLALKQVTGSNKLFADSQQFLKEVSDAYGIEINELTKQFTQFYVSAKGKISEGEIKQIFESITKSAGFMGLTVDAQKRTFTALSQMMSKGKVSSEELRQQLGEALPGAFRIMAKAMGTTDEGLEKLMKDGNLLSSEALPKLAKEIEKTYGIENKNRVDSLAASQERLSNAWTDFVRSLNNGSGIMSKALMFILNELKTTIQFYRDLNTSEEDLHLERLRENTSKFYKSTKKELDDVADSADRYSRAMTFKHVMRQNIIDLKEDNAEIIKKIRLLELEKKENPIKFAMLRKQTFLDREISKLRENELAMARNSGKIKAYNEIINGKEIKNKKIITELTKKHTEAQRKEIETYKERIELLKDEEKGTKSLLETLEYQKKQLEQEQRMLSKNNIEWRMYQKLIDGVDKSIKQLTDTQDYLGDSGKKVADELTQLGEKMKAQEEATKKMKDATDEWLKSIQSGFLEDAGLGSLNFFLDIQENGLTMYEELMKGADPLAKKFAITFKGITDVAKEAFSFITQASQSAYNAELSNLEKRKEISLKYAGESATAREEIERQYEQKRKAIERQRAEQEKKQAILNVIINTAQAISAAVAKSPLTGGMPFTAIAAAIGAAQIAVISSAEIPNYEHGTDNHKGGLMLINDAKGSNYTEAVKTPDGRITKYKGRNVLVNAPKGTEVLTAQETVQFDKDLNNLLMNNEISQNVVNNGIDINDLDSVMGKYFRNIQINNTTFDKDGISSFYMKNGQKTKTLDRIVTFKGFSV